MSQLATQPSKASVPFGPEGFVIQDLEGAYRWGQCVIASGLAPRGFDKPEQVIIALQYGAELGLKPMQALQSIAVINGRPSIYGDGLRALLLARPDCKISDRMEGDGDARCCRVTITRGGVPTERTFSVGDAKRAGLWGKQGPWTQYPDRMLMWRAFSYAARDAYADVLRGIGVVEEVEDIPVKVVVSKSDAIAAAVARTNESTRPGGAAPTDAGGQPGNVIPPDSKAGAGSPSADGGGRHGVPGEPVTGNDPPDETPAAAEPPVARHISPAQLKRLHAIRNDAAIVSKSDFDLYLFDTHGIESSKDIPVGLYDRIVAFCETGKA